MKSTRSQIPANSITINETVADLPIALPLSDENMLQQCVEAMLAQTELYVRQPCPLPCARPAQKPNYFKYSIYDIDPRAYRMLEENEQLQLWLEGEIMLTAVQFSPFTMDACESLLQSLATLLNVTDGKLKSKIEVLQILQELTVEMFKHFSAGIKLDSAPNNSSIALSAALVDSFKGLGIKLEASAIPVDAYFQISRKWVELEQSIAAQTQQCLSLKLQVMRLSLYKSVGSYLAQQARTILSHGLIDEEWTAHGEVHRGRSVLEDCVAEPFMKRCPVAT